MRGKIGEAISNGKLKGLAIMRSHGGRVRALVTGETQIDIAFIGTPTCDEYGNCRGIGGKSDCGVLSYAMSDAFHANKVVAITDCMVPFPNFPAHISMTKVDYVVEVDQIGDPKKIATGAKKPTTDMRKLMMADYCTQFVVNTPYFKDGFSYQTGVGGASIASTISLAKVMKERNIRMRFGVGGLTKPMCDLLINGQVDALLDTQDFDLAAVESVKDLHHFRISAGEYANPFNKGAVVNKLDFVILAALEVDVHFNCNVVVDSNGMITGAQGWTSGYSNRSKMCHRYRTASSGKNTGNLYRRNNRHNTGRKCRRCHHRLWYCNQPEETGSDRSNERCRPSI